MVCTMFQIHAFLETKKKKRKEKMCINVHVPPCLEHWSISTLVKELRSNISTTASEPSILPTSSESTIPTWFSMKPRDTGHIRHVMWWGWISRLQRPSKTDIEHNCGVREKLDSIAQSTEVGLKFNWFSIMIRNGYFKNLCFTTTQNRTSFSTTGCKSYVKFTHGSCCMIP